VQNVAQNRVSGVADPTASIENSASKSSSAASPSSNLGVAPSHWSTIDFDAVVIGAGINGCGVARDLTLRGLRVALVDRRDIGSGTSGHSSSMIHGGPRYLSSERHVTLASATDAGYVVRAAPHLVFRIPFLLPIYRQMSFLYREAFEAYWEAYDHFQPLKGGKSHVRLSAAEARRVEPGLADDVVGAITFDEWGVDGTRLCLANAFDARARGAKIFTHRAVTSFWRDGARIAGVVLDDGQRLSAKVVVNVAGPWAPRVAALAGVTLRIRPGKGIHLFFARRISNYGLMALAIDRRWIFVEPHQNGALLGTTDDDYYGSLEELQATRDETSYLLEGIASVLPSIREHRFVRTTVGIRPSLYRYGQLEDKVSRDHATYDHEPDGAPGLVTMLGGKLASYRSMAEDVSDLVARKLGIDVPCSTHVTPLPGGRDLPDVDRLAEEFRIMPITTARLATRHGGQSKEVLDGLKVASPDAPAGANDAGRTVLCPCEPVLAAEVEYAVRTEGAQSIDDVRRRTRLAEGVCQGTTCIGHAAACLHGCGLEIGAVHESVNAALDERFRGRVVALDYGLENLAQEELLQGRYFLVGDYGRTVM
jgi:glycerol-3-phosphate dehydrogenase